MVLPIEYLIFITTIILGLVYLASQKRPRGFPPGPLGLPLIGHLAFLGMEPWKTAAAWKTNYGAILGVQFGSIRTVIISDFKLIKDAFNQNAFAIRPPLQFMADRSGGKPEGIVFTSGRTWQEQRRFTLRHLREFGFGTKSMETIVHDEIEELIERLKATVGTPIAMANRFNIAIVNALWTIIAGERFRQDDPRLNDLIRHLTNAIGENNFVAAFTTFIPWIAKYFPEISGYIKLLAGHWPIQDFLRSYIEDHMKTHEPGCPRDFMDVYIDEIKKTEDPASSFHKDQKFSMLTTILDLFLGGAETTSTALNWILLYMARNQHVQEKLADEIQRIVGNSRLPSLSDRPEMHYTEAVIHEVLRKVTLLPLSVMHGAAEDASFHGYNIPKGTMVMANTYEVHNDIELWGDPENFRPERFLSKDESEFERRDGFLAFSVGKRQCLGEALARDELFLFTSTLFQVFHVNIDKNGPIPTLEPHVGAVLSAKPHQVVLTVRK